ncbi:MAG: DUF4412 domain-containing protein [Balneolaceae bacterium]|nr:DUF4412 domain-containing protein [Balneolaceae bacterium]
MKIRFIPLVLLILMLSAVSALGQFQGKIVYESREINEEGSGEHRDTFTMYVTPDRILLEGKNRYEFIGSIKTEGLLIRLDFKDFVFLTGDSEAMKISQSDIDMLVKMFGGSSDRSDQAESGIKLKASGETRSIHGYSCEKFVITDDEDPDDFVEVWMTRDLKINWGMLAELWEKSGTQFVGDDLPMDLIFIDGYLPLKIEAYQNGQLREVTETNEISETPISKAMVQIPSGVKILSFQDYLFQKMGQ